MNANDNYDGEGGDDLRIDGRGCLILALISWLLLFALGFAIARLLG